MKKLILLTTFLFAIQASYGQIKSDNWIRTKVTYIDGAELEDMNPLKYVYLRYSIERSKIWISNNFQNIGNEFTYSIINDVLQIKNNTFTVNEFKIESNNDSTLILLQKGSNGFDGDDCIRFYFIPERKYQENYKPTSEEILSISGTDTVFIAKSKLYPVFKGNKDYFDVLKQGAPEQPSANLHF